MIADIPAISTYVAFGYPENRARRDKAIPQGNALKNRVRKAMEELGYSEKMVRIFDWEHEIEHNPDYIKQYEKVSALYKTNPAFHAVAHSTTRAVLISKDKHIPDVPKAANIAVHYLLSEIAFLEFVPQYLGVAKVSYVYHKNWQVYEDYVSGKFDGVSKSHMDFLLIENPYETYNPIWGLEEAEKGKAYGDVLERIQNTNTLRVGFVHSVPTFMYDRDYQNFSGIFYEVIVKIAKKYGWKIRFSEEVGYGVIAKGLDENRFDMFGPTVWPSPEREKIAMFTESLFSSPIFTCVRQNDIRTEEALRRDEYARVVIIEGDIVDTIATADFPKNRRSYVPQLSSNVERAQFVADGRGDFTFIEKYMIHYFNKTAKTKLVTASDKPIRVYKNTFMIKQGEERLRQFLNAEIAELEGSGVIKELLKKYLGDEKLFTTFRKPGILSRFMDLWK